MKINYVKVLLGVIGVLGVIELGGIMLSSFEDQNNKPETILTEEQYKEKLRKNSERIKAEREAKLAAMTPEERNKFLQDESEKRKKLEEIAAKSREEEQKKKAEEEKAEKFRKQQVAYSYALKTAIIESAFDPGSLIFKDTEYYANGVCIKANGKNRFGGYVGFKEYCALVDKKGKWKIHK